MTNIEELEKQIEQKIQEVREKRKQLAEAKLSEVKEYKKARLRGRPPISKEKLLEAELDAYNKTLTYTAFKHDVSVRTLYRHGITRKALNKKIAGKEKESGIEID